jgi:recombination protein RecT
MNNLELIKQELNNNEELAIKFKNATEELDFIKEINFATQILQNNNYLQTMPKDSIIEAIYNVALTGLSLNPKLEMAYLLPRKGKCILEISYKGMITLLSKFNIIKDVSAHVVYEKDVFDIEYGTHQTLTHKPKLTGERGVKIGAYCICELKNGIKKFEFIRIEELHKIKQRSEAVKAKKGSPYDNDEDEMFRKTVIRRIWKYLPKETIPNEIVDVIDIDTQNNGIDFETERKENKIFQNIKKEEANDISDEEKEKIRFKLGELINAAVNDADFNKIIEDLKKNTLIANNSQFKGELWATINNAAEFNNLHFNMETKRFEPVFE